jgi:uncharacterized membrane protein YhhN
MRFNFLFFGLLVAELTAVLMDSKSLEYISKPSLMLALGIYFFLETTHIARKKQRNRVLLGAFFSLLGDVLLMFSGGFILGLAAFLTAHIFYISAFYLDNDGFIFKKNDRIAAGIGFLSYATVFLYFVLPKVDNTLQLPILAYGITILTMLLTALNRWKNVDSNTFKWVLLGAILFVLSDSLLAINRFVQPFSFSGIAIMLTYALGQFLIVQGVLMRIKMGKV